MVFLNTYSTSILIILKFKAVKSVIPYQIYDECQNMNGLFAGSFI